jgi:uncharacterized protein
MKRLSLFLLVIFLILLISPLALGADVEPISDDAELLTVVEYRKLNGRAREIEALYDCEVAIITLSESGGRDLENYSRQLYKNLNLGSGPQRSGLLLFLSMEDRDYSLIAHGYGNTAFTDYGKDVLLDKHVLPLLAEDNYYGAFSAYLETSADYLAMAREGTPFDRNTDPAHARMVTLVKLAVVVLLPVIIACVICLSWRAKMKTAVSARSAGNYIPEGGFHLTGKEDRFLYRTETRRTIESKSTGGTSVGGDGFSGRSGKF